MAAQLRQLGHQAWTAHDAGLARASDDDLAVYAHERNAVLLTHDREFSRRRRTWTIGRHVYLRCAEWEAADLLANALPELLPILERKADVFITLSAAGYEVAL